MRTTRSERRRQHHEDDITRYRGSMRLREQLGPALRDLRKSRGWSQEQLAQRAGGSKQNVSQLELGQRGELLDNIDELIRTLGGEIHVYVTRPSDGVSIDEVGAALRALDPALRSMVWDLVRALPLMSEDARDLVGHAARNALTRHVALVEPSQSPERVVHTRRR